MSTQELRRGIGLIALISIGLSGIVGSGIFVLPATLAATAGPGMLVSIVCSGLIALLLAFPYIELGSMFPKTGGPFFFPKIALGSLGGFLMGWGYFLYLVIGTAAIANIFVVYLGFYFPSLVSEGVLTVSGIGVALFFVWFLTFLNIVGVKWGGYYAIVMVVGRFIPLLLFCGMGLFSSRGEAFSSFIPFGWKGVTLAITLFFWSYTGFEALVVPLEEVKNPKKTLPRAMLCTIGTVMILYLLLGISFLRLIDWKDLGIAFQNWERLSELNAPLANVLGTSKKSLSIWISIGALFATGGAVGSWILIQGRLPFAMAEENLFWQRARVLSRFGTPLLSLIFSSICTSLVLICVPCFVTVSLIASITAVLPYGAAALAIPILRKRKKDVERPFALPVPHLFSFCAFLLATCLVYWAGWPWTFIGMLLFFSGLCFYLMLPSPPLEWKRNLWLVCYLLGISAIAFASKKCFLSFPYDLGLLLVFGSGIYSWAYWVNTQPSV